MAIDFRSLRVLARDLNFAVHGIDATVRLPDTDATIATRVIWCVPPLEQVPSGTGFQRADPQRILALRRDEVPSVPRGTRIVVAPGSEGAVAGWIVDGFDRVENDHIRVIVVEDPDYEVEET